LGLFGHILPLFNDCGPRLTDPAPDLRGTESIHVRDASYGHSGALADCTVTDHLAVPAAWAV